MSAYTDSIRRDNVTSTDQAVTEHVTIRRAYEDGKFVGGHVFVGGWRVASLKTERGLLARALVEVENTTPEEN